MTSSTETWDGRARATEPPFGASVIVHRRVGTEREFLVLHRAERGLDYEGDWAWTPPSGARLPGEAIERCAERELFEEAGLSARLRALPSTNPEWATFEAEIAGDAEVALGDAEHDRYEWVSLVEALRRCLPAQVAEAFRKVDDRRALAGAIYRAAHLTGTFELRSGVTATEYFDKYRFESDPKLLRAIAQHLAPFVPPDTEILAGLELGGVPIATAMSLETGLPAAFVRKQAKPYGTRRLAEGIDIAGRRVLVVEDVATSGGQIVLSTAELRALGATVSKAVCVIDRDSGASEALSRIDVGLSALFTKRELEAEGA